MASYGVVDERVDGAEGVALISGGGDLRAAFAPGAGMVGYSLAHRGEELLGQRGGMAAYRERGSTFGIPLLHPWANRLAGFAYSVDGRRVELDRGHLPVTLDPNGLPIHGLVAGFPEWEVIERVAGDDRAELAARLDFARHVELAAGFPWPHELQVHAELADDTLTVATTLRPTGELAVPIAFGWHPYLRLPGAPRSEWCVELPVRTRAELDGRGLPTGRVEPVAVEPGPLGDRTYDDLFPGLSHPAVFALEAGGRRIEVEFGERYPVAQVYAPPDEEYVCFEPMTAPTNALISGDGLRTVAPGERFRAEFRVRVLAA